jgi:hypothetical protein
MSATRRRDLARRKIEREHVLAFGVCALADRVGVIYTNPKTLEQATVPPCEGRLTFGHVKKAGQGGEYDRSNGLPECWYHNAVWIETGPRWLMELLGLVPKTWRTS